MMDVHVKPPAKLTYLSRHKGEEYSDGDAIEDYLLDIFKQGLSEKERSNILNSSPTWPIRYHLAYERKSLLGWYPFEPGSKVLEIGAGCGSITESLVEHKDIDVVANDLSERRCLINAYRNRDAHNLEIIVGNIYDYKPRELFDYVVCVGVFEYAGTFINTINPYLDFLKKLKSSLKPGGKLLLAIENQLGLKYLAGAREDHTGGYFDGINDYPGKKAVRTFGKTELERQIKKSGFNNLYFYYPFPDYKLPSIIYSDEYYPHEGHVHFPRGVLPTHNPDQPREILFAESSFVSILERNDLFREFSNSFLVEGVAT